jgi:2,3-bisphosphoglycerate-independent phosphoglycerate mutase
MKVSNKLLSSHPVNLDRISRGLNPANSIWFWGEGRKPALEDFYKLHNKKGAVISAVDLLKGIGKAAGMEVIEVDGATGNIDTNFDGKAQAAIDALSRNDYVYIHLEAPDECGHQGNYDAKKRAIELIDEKIVAPVKKFMDERGLSYKIAILPDHATPVTLKTHVSDPVPYLIYDSENEVNGVPSLTEENAAKTGNDLDSGVALMKKLFE